MMNLYPNRNLCFTFILVLPSVTVLETAAEEIDDPPLELTQDLTKETILQTARLFVRNLAFSCTDADLLKLFRPNGEVYR